MWFSRGLAGSNCLPPRNCKFYLQQITLIGIICCMRKTPKTRKRRLTYRVCIICSRRFKASRVDAELCSSTCRSRYNRGWRQHAGMIQKPIPGLGGKR